MRKSEERKEAWFRILVTIVSGVILGVWKTLIWVLAIVHFFIVLFTGKRNKDIAEFSEYWNTELYRFVRYITFVTNERPFPFTNMDKRMSRFSR